MRAVPLLVVFLLVAPTSVRAEASPDTQAQVDVPRAAPAHLRLLDEGLLDDGSGDDYDRGGSYTPRGHTLGVGLQLGFPSAITLELVLGGKNSIIIGVGAFGYRFFGQALSLHVDYLWHPAVLLRQNNVAVSWYIGVGGWLMVYSDRGRYGYVNYGFDSNLALALRVPIGIDVALSELPVMFYVELVPAVLIFPGIDVGLGASVGARVFF
jgi:hypothetical protein